MSPPPAPSDDPLRDLSARADALERSAARPQASASKAGATNQAYRLVTDLFGGVLVGLALGFGLDRLTGRTAPFGLIGGVLLGFAVSVWMAKRTADRLMAQAARENTNPPTSAPFDDDDDDD